MAKYTDESNITFNNAAAAGGSAKITNRFNDYTDLESGVNPIINAIEIDWNEAAICNQSVKTTGQLLKIINDLYNKVNNISTDVKVSSIDLNYSGTWNPSKLNDTKTVTATVYPSNATNKAIKWSCTTSDLVKFSSTTSTSTTITALKYGSGTIKCTAQDGSGVVEKFYINFIEPTTTQASTPTPSPSSTDTPTPEVTTTTPAPQTHYTSAVMLLGAKATAISSMTASAIEAATSFQTKTVDTQSLNSYTEFQATNSRSSVIIRLNRYATSVPVIYPKTVQFYNTTTSAWENVAYGSEPIRVHSSGNYNYFVIHPASATGVKYRVNFTTSNPGYATIGGGTSGGTVEPSTTGSTSGSTPSSTVPATT